MKKTIAYITIFFAILLLLTIDYLIMPVWSLNYGLSLFMLFIITSIIAGIIILLSKHKIAYYSLLLVGLVMLVAVGQFFRSSTIFQHQNKRALLGGVTEKEFSTEISPVDLSRLPEVTPKMALNLGDKRLGENLALGSQVTLREFWANHVNGELYYVAPLEHTGFFRWMDNKQGTPGYVIINAANQRDVRLVQEINGSPIQLKYQPSSYLGDDLKRKIYRSGYRNVGLTDFSFELDDDFNPYWVVTLYKNTLGTSGADAVGVLVVDPQTGEIEEYDLENMPDWVDRAIPMDMAIKQVNYWGKLINGWWNPSKRGMLQTTSGTNVVYNEGRSYYYTGITSAGADESTIGFMLLDTRTKESVLYRISGATENAAMKSAEGAVQQFEYTATFPILINLEGEPTYYMTLLDRQGLIKQFAFVNVRDYSIVGIGETKNQASSNYVSRLRDRGQWSPIENVHNEVELEGTVLRIGSSIVDSTTYYYLLLDTMEDKILIAPLTMSNQLPLTKEGDTVKIKYFDSPSPTVNLSNFTNLQIKGNN